MIADSRIKKDKVDSKALAELLRLNALPESYYPRINELSSCSIFFNNRRSTSR